jgi:hypothetical protein
MAFLRIRGWLPRQLLGALALLLGTFGSGGAMAQALSANSETALKVAFIYNFTLFTEWPAEVGSTLNLCVAGRDPFGQALDILQGKMAAGRTLVLHRKNVDDSLAKCQVVFIAPSAMSSLPRLLEGLADSPTLTIADSPGAVSRGVALNMNVVNNKVTFEANLQAVHGARLNLSSKLLRLATGVIP